MNQRYNLLFHGTGTKTALLTTCALNTVLILILTVGPCITRDTLNGVDKSLKRLESGFDFAANSLVVVP
jgi:hypothetical protein